MNFHSAEYGLLLVVAFALNWLFGGRSALRYGLLLALSYGFYSVWAIQEEAPHYLMLIVGSTMLDYWIGNRLADTSVTATGPRRALLITSLVGNLGVLALFKYYDFFRLEIRSAFGFEFLDLDLLLPVGISFYTFQSLSYTIDIYRGTLRPARNPLEFALFVAFFPQLVAGPIVRASEFLPQLEQRPRLDAAGLHESVYRILVGLGKKVLIADPLGVLLVDPAFAAGSEVHGVALLLAVYGYALQIYCDFSGYSDIAIGSARLLGFRLPENFHSPYRATSLQDFWRRWHVTLSQWLRDYLYISLGGNRRGAIRTYVNLLLTMVLGGLWHGASWNFVIWGALHGGWLAIERAVDPTRRLGQPVGQRKAVHRLLGWLLTQHLVCLAWVFFRASDFDGAIDVLSRIAMGGSSELSWAPLVTVGLVLGVLTHLLPRDVEAAGRAAFVRQPSFVVGLWIALWIGIFAAADIGGAAFIYFQF